MKTLHILLVALFLSFLGISNVYTQELILSPINEIKVLTPKDGQTNEVKKVNLLDYSQEENAIQRDGKKVRFIPAAFYEYKGETQKASDANSFQAESTRSFNAPKPILIEDQGAIKVYLESSSNLQSESNSPSKTAANASCGFCQVMVDQNGATYFVRKSLFLTTSNRATAKSLAAEVDGLEFQAFLSPDDNQSGKTFYKIPDLSKLAKIMQALDAKNYKYQLDLVQNFAEVE